jgi:hypothetical protein
MRKSRLSVARELVRAQLAFVNHQYDYGLSVRKDGRILRNGRTWFARATLESSLRKWTFDELVQRQLDRTAMG